MNALKQVTFRRTAQKSKDLHWSACCLLFLGKTFMKTASRDSHRSTPVPSRIYDVSMLLHSDMLVFPDDPKFRTEAASRIEQGDPANVTQIHMGTHTGTHVDAPRHFYDEREGASQLMLEKLVGPALVLEIFGKQVELKDLEDVDLNENSRVLFKTENSRKKLLHKKEYDENFVVIGEEAAQYLAQKKVALVGIDYLSVEAPENSDDREAYRVHHALLSAGTIIVEGLDLSEVSKGAYELLCLPLRIKGADGSPARVILRPLQERNKT